MRSRASAGSTRMPVDYRGGLRSRDERPVALATATADGLPSVRFVLLRGVDDDGFRFYTNRDSRKGHELKDNPRAAIVVYWPRLGRQVRAEGPVHLLTETESAAYFATRP